MFFLQDI